VHSLLTDSLVRGTASRAMSDYGLGVAGAAGKTGTAYNFTDVWFLGYTEAVTCGVWMGFDRPRQIFRGAFGKDLALPVWVDVMNSSREDFPSEPIKAPVTVEQVEVCRVSGELATDKCLERVVAPGAAATTESTVYAEYARIGKAPSVSCTVHAGGIKSYVKEYAEEEWPRAAAAVDLSKVRPVDVSSAPVLGAADPYNAISPASMDVFGGEVPVAEAVQVASLPAAPAEGGEGAATAPAEVRKAEPAGVKDAVAQERPQMELPEPPPIRF